MFLEHVVNYANLNEADGPSSSEQSTSNVGVAPKFIDTINPLLKFSNDDLEAMNDDVNDLIESDSSDDDDVDDDMDLRKHCDHFFVFFPVFFTSIDQFDFFSRFSQKTHH